MLTRKLPVKLTKEEIRLKGKRLATLEAEVETLEDEKKAKADDFKSKINARRTEILGLTREINEEREYRQVEVAEQKDYDLMEVQIVRKDTLEVVEARPMTPQERNRPLPFNAVRDEAAV